MFESFALSASISAGCEEVTKLQGEGSCGWEPDERWTSGPIFISDITGCDVTPAESGYDNLCYDVPQESYNLFNS